MRNQKKVVRAIINQSFIHLFIYLEAIEKSLTKNPEFVASPLNEQVASLVEQCSSVYQSFRESETQ